MVLIPYLILSSFADGIMVLEPGPVDRRMLVWTKPNREEGGGVTD